MKTICAWCKKLLSETEDFKEYTSHGICKDCLNKMEDKL